MIAALKKIFDNTNDFKICKTCDMKNWYENAECCTCINNIFNSNFKNTEKFVGDEISYCERPNQGYLKLCM